ncbi:13992_t:CDS:2 [Funneliformis mosseae]|uniref:13992_t:CDS:1 n=1 Tax=Funneliformis mosseae TaxID=27381 RepID=A0A9N9EKH7_FUNMO|nr:13992_t:CDS:2 [Funneliformis mosseae]
MLSSAEQENINNDNTKKYIKRPQKPDEESYKLALEEVKNKIDKLQEESDAINAKIGASDNGPAGSSREELRGQLDRLRGKQDEIKKSRSSTIEKIRSLGDSIQRKKRDLKQVRDKVQYRTVKDIDIAISLIESGTLKIIEEKRTIAEISNLERSKKSVKQFEIQQNAIDEEQKAIDELKKTLEDSDFKKINEEYDDIKAKLDVINKDLASDREKRNELFDQKKKIREQINELFANRREIQDQHSKAKSEYWKYQEDEQKRRQELRRKLDEEREKQYKQDVADRKREEAAIPAFQSDIVTCDNLIYYFQSYNGGKSPQPQPHTPSTTPVDSNIRQPDATSNVPEGAVLMKKSDREDAYFAGGSKKHKKSPKEKKAGKSNSLQLPFSVMDQLISFKIATPHNFSDIEQTIEGLIKKKEYFIENQERITRENIEKVEAEIAAMEEKGFGYKKKVTTSEEEKVKMTTVIISEDDEKKNEITAAVGDTKKEKTEDN